MRQQKASPKKWTGFPKRKKPSRTQLPRLLEGGFFWDESSTCQDVLAGNSSNKPLQTWKPSKQPARRRGGGWQEASARHPRLCPSSFCAQIARSHQSHFGFQENSNFKMVGKLQPTNCGQGEVSEISNCFMSSSGSRGTFLSVSEAGVPSCCISTQNT